jgi:hypothetical protein
MLGDLKDDVRPETDPGGRNLENTEETRRRRRRKIKTPPLILYEPATSLSISKVTGILMSRHRVSEPLTHQQNVFCS